MNALRSSLAAVMAVVMAMALAVCALATGVAAAATVLATTVDTTEGPLLGTVETPGIHVYRGVPFAAPPVGPLRWREPQAPARRTAVRVAETVAPDCVQGSLGPAPPGLPVAASGHEDCLYLNVWTPSAPGAPGPNAARDTLPVMVWIFGGGFQRGGASDPRFDGTRLAQRGVVVVTLNYRVGILGFLAHPELGRESAHGASGNYGILDQIAALRWVQANIAAFGGDPQRVTVFGQSAGATSISILQASPLARGLFQRAIGQSTSQLDPAVGVTGRRSLAQAEADGVRIAATLGASSLAELRALPAGAFASQPPQFWPIERDGHVLPDTVFATFAAGRQHPVDLLVGSNDAEGLTLRIPWVKPDAQEQAAFERLYANAPGHQVFSDVVQWQMRTWALLHAQSGRPSYLYWFDQVPPVAAERLRQFGGAPAGAFHGAEVAYVFGNLAPELPWSAADRRLSEQIMTRWVHFARSGNPNRPGLPVWPRVDPLSPRLMKLGEQAATIAVPRPEAQAFLDAYFAKRREEKPR